MSEKQLDRYRYIRAWGLFMGSHNYYIQDQQALACKEGAPENALFKEADGSWATISNASEEMVRMLDRLLYQSGWS